MWLKLFLNIPINESTNCLRNSSDSQVHPPCWFSCRDLFLDKATSPYLTPPSQPLLWQFSSVSQELSGVSEALRCEWRTCGTKSVTLRRQWTRIGMNRRCLGLRPLAGAKQNVCDNRAECITSWKTVCLWLQVRACVSETEETETHSSAGINVSNNTLVCAWASVPARSSICMLSSPQSPCALIIHIELLKTCHVLIIKRISSTKCSFEEHPNSSRKEDYKKCGSLLGNKHD